MQALCLSAEHTESVKYIDPGFARYDVLLTADHPSRSYFITVASQYRPGAPNGYGFLHYSNASSSGLPPTPTVQENATLPWNQSQIDKARDRRSVVADQLPFEATSAVGHDRILQQWSSSQLSNARGAC